MATSILTATIATVKLGNLEFEGLMFEDGSFGISVPQIAMLFPYFKTDKNNASILLKRLMGKDFKTDKSKTAFNKNITTYVDLIAFERIIRKLDKQNDPVAENIAESLIGLSLTQLFSDAFHQKFEAEDRQQYLIRRQESKQTFWLIASCVKDWYELTKVERSAPPHVYYSQAFDAINLGLFGKKSKQMKDELGRGKGDLVRDDFSPEALRRITSIQEIAANYLKNEPTHKPTLAIAFALNVCGYQVIDYR